MYTKGTDYSKDLMTAAAEDIALLSHDKVYNTYLEKMTQKTQKYFSDSIDASLDFIEETITETYKVPDQTTAATMLNLYKDVMKREPPKVVAESPHARQSDRDLSTIGSEEQDDTPEVREKGPDDIIGSDINTREKDSPMGKPLATIGTKTNKTEQDMSVAVKTMMDSFQYLTNICVMSRSEGNVLRLKPGAIKILELSGWKWRQTLQSTYGKDVNLHINRSMMMLRSLQLSLIGAFEESFLKDQNDDNRGMLTEIKTLNHPHFKSVAESTSKTTILTLVAQWKALEDGRTLKTPIHLRELLPGELSQKFTNMKATSGTHSTRPTPQDSDEDDAPTVSTNRKRKPKTDSSISKKNPRGEF
jgi:hypothetical protein